MPSVLARRAAKAGICARRVREEKERLKADSKKHEAPKCRPRRNNPAQSRTGVEASLRHQLSRSKKYAQAIHLRNQNNLVRRPLRRPRLPERQHVPLTSKPTDMHAPEVDLKSTVFEDDEAPKRPPRRLIEKEWQLLNQFNNHVHHQKLQEERAHKLAMQRKQAAKLEGQLKMKDMRGESRRREQQSYAKVLFNDMKAFREEEEEKEKKKREKVAKIKRERSEQLRVQALRAEQRRKKKYETEQREILEVRSSLERERKELLQAKMKNLKQQRKVIEENKRWQAQKKTQAIKQLQVEKLLAKEYQEKLDKEQRLREEQLKQLYSVQEKNLNLALYVHHDVEVAKNADEARNRKFQEEKDRREETDARQRAEKVMRMKATLRKNLIEQLEAKKQAKFNEEEEERLYAKQVTAKSIVDARREEEKQRLIREKSYAHRVKLEDQIRRHRARRLHVDMGTKQLRIHKALLDKASAWASDK